MPTGQAPIHTNQLFSPLESFLRFEKQKNSYFFKLLTSTVRTFNILCTNDKMYMTDMYGNNTGQQYQVIISITPCWV